MKAFQYAPARPRCAKSRSKYSSNIVPRAATIEPDRDERNHVAKEMGKRKRKETLN
jgi:hypothetical protein